MTKEKVFVILVITFISCVFAQTNPPPSERIQGLKDYVYQNDYHYAWNVSSSVVEGRGYKAYSIFLTSQVISKTQFK